MAAKYHIVRTTTVETEEFMSIYNAERRVNELNEKLKDYTRNPNGSVTNKVELIKMQDAA